MAVDAKHPRWDEMADDWQLMRDVIAGERIVKSKTTVYLPATEGQSLRGLDSGQRGWNEYVCYRTRALFPEIVDDGLAGMVGIMHRKPAIIEVPTAMEPMLEDITRDGETAQQLLSRITEETLSTGRLGLFLDIPTTDEQNPLPYIATFAAETIINWDTSADAFERDRLRLVILDETEQEIDAEYEWAEAEKFRIARMNESGQYETFQQRKGEPEGEIIVPRFNGQALEEIPFVFVGSRDLTADPDRIPTLYLARLALTIYRGEADYRQSLFLQGQDTLVMIGATADESELITGAGAFIQITSPDGDAKYIGASSDGLAEQRQALENDYQRASEIGAKLLSGEADGQESGEALRIRTASKTANLSTVAIAAAGGLEAVLQISATWMGLDPEDVKVTPNLDFVDDPLLAAELVQLMTAKTAGAPLSLETIHQIMREREMTDLSFEEEVEKINDEPTGIEPTTAPVDDQDGDQ